MSGYQVPVARIARPEKIGFEVSIPDDQTWAADIIRTDQKGRWTYTNRDAKLKKGDVLYYWTTVRYNGVDYHRMRQSADL
ncbi:gram-negative bacteria-binding protein 3 isoform X2 [Drosophila elegans]|uniref:gram-negative bacteria-binding protein 3 isoform X2 n=1 Tax=Drosophila elegans TaxID=30023 RepID=UPI0007E8A866|nr:gram-negative bacteria-binding protein 3 isoform X2 [Drosophila elegans]